MKKSILILIAFCSLGMYGDHVSPSRYYAGMFLDPGDSPITIALDDPDEWAAVHGLTIGHCDTANFSCEAGGISSYTSVADIGGGLLRFTTSTPHGFSTDHMDYADIHGAVYDGFYLIVSMPDTTHFDITETDGGTDTGTATNGSHFTMNDGGLEGLYKFNWATSFSGGVGKLYKIGIAINGVVMERFNMERYTANNDTGAKAGVGSIDLFRGDHFFFTVKCVTNPPVDFEMKTGEVFMLKVP